MLAGHSHSEDASVYRINANTAIINTVDVFTPVVDDPYEYGQITAANSLSDVYAMGGQPLVAMNVLAFHQGKISAAAITKMLQGAQDKAKEAGCVISGGHSIQDSEIKYGLAVTGIVHPKSFWRNHTPEIGDALVLTKPLGTGCMSSALKHDRLAKNDLTTITESMKTLNRMPAEILQESAFTVHACTDITGFGLAGHLLEMINQTPTSAHIHLDALPVFPNVFDYLADPAFLPGGFYANKLYNEQYICPDEKISDEEMRILFDPQTSGGLLVSLPENQAVELIGRLKDKYPLPAAIIGNIEAERTHKIRLSL